jgi:hypothetical protein
MKIPPKTKKNQGNLQIFCDNQHRLNNAKSTQIYMFLHVSTKLAATQALAQNTYRIPIIFHVWRYMK